MSSTGDRRRGHLAAAAVVLLLLTGCVGAASVQTGATTASSSASAPPASPSARPTDAAPTPPTQKPSTARTPGARLPAMAASEPVSVRISSTGTQSGLLSLGLRDDGSLEVPPGDPGAPAAWYDGSPTPGERGPAILLGHVNATDGGPGVFAGLRELKPGDTVEISREDGTTAVFAVERGEQYAKDSFPTLAVYGSTEGAELRLITCDGYDPATGQFDDNYVVYAELVD